MKKLCIIKTGTAPAAVKEKYGDFEDMILAKTGLEKQRAQVFPVYLKNHLPEIKDIAGVIITGSKSMVTDRLDWSNFVSDWLKDIAKTRIPVLGICYGHQLIAQTFGGNVDYHPKGEEIGEIDVQLTEYAAKDPLFKVMPNRFSSFAKHSQSVIKLPAEAILLAQNSFEPHHAFSLFGHIWGVQFHPEFTADIMRSYMDFDREKLKSEGVDAQTLYDTTGEAEYGEIFLKQFCRFF